MKNPSQYLLHRILQKLVHSVIAPKNRTLVLFAIEGALITFVTNLVSNYNNLFATRLGASDFELSLVITLPQLVGMLVLIPGGILTDRMKNKRNMVTSSLVILAVAYFVIGFTPMLGVYKLIAFLVLLALATGPLTIYNVSWQAYFSDVVKGESRNSILTVRNGLTFLIGILVPFSCGALLASATTLNDKLEFHQIFFWISGVLLILQVFVLKKIQSNEVHVPSGINFRELIKAIQELKSNRKFLGFIGVAIFFYLTWHIDWTLYFLGQVNYLGMNEAWLSYISIGNAVVQFITIGIWSRLNVKMGVRFAIIFGNLGLAFCPISMIVATSVPDHYGKIVFLILNTIANIALATTSLNILQCLLQVLPEKNKTLNISLYTVLVTLSNAVMPLVGVSIYTAMGADRVALHQIFWLIFILRIVSTFFWAMRWWILRKEAK